MILIYRYKSYSYDYDLGRMEGTNGTIGTNSGIISALQNLTDEESTILNLIKADASLTQKRMQEKTGYSLRTVKRVMAKLQKDGIIIRIGNNRSGKWQVKVCAIVLINKYFKESGLQ